MNPTGSLGTIIHSCTVAALTKAQMPTSRFGPVVYGGSYGLGLLTRDVILDRNTLRFDSELNARGVIYVRLKVPALGQVDVFCTHLTPSIAGLAPPRDRSWAELHSAEVAALLQWIDAKSDAQHPILLIGDLNAGPSAGPWNRAVLPRDYEHIVAYGFVNAYPTSTDASCTFCDENPLNGGTGRSGAIIDHILVKNFTGAVRVEPILREPITLRVDGKAVTAAYSDHYGLMATLDTLR
jgi:endonuclease/exonuclease/phosphatase family metal-dependent hydrolase